MTPSHVLYPFCAVLQADVLVQIPTNPYFSSLNLAQAVALVGYECYASMHSAPAHESLEKSNAKADDADASKAELDNLGDLEDLLRFSH